MKMSVARVLTQKFAAQVSGIVLIADARKFLSQNRYTAYMGAGVSRPYRGDTDLLIATSLWHPAFR
jgi:hypothetical protein